ncbi:hypothetical protein E2C01_012029 [Portunus trituberculatus]|uniref:Uncharacterized protein n=1 Tax=Portunus trituberculatus TaxID=210409 RepID=A0A5B7DCL6_PORTR|nr:hypothetical protein [Portunus trituberculatus]
MVRQKYWEEPASGDGHKGLSRTLRYPGSPFPQRLASRELLFMVAQDEVKTKNECWKSKGYHDATTQPYLVYLRVAANEKWLSNRIHEPPFPLLTCPTRPQSMRKKSTKQSSADLMPFDLRDHNPIKREVIVVTSSTPYVTLPFTSPDQ